MTCLIIFGRTTGQYSVRAGTSDHLIGGTVHPVVEITVHPQYDDVLYDYDITLMKIDPPIEFDSAKQAISISDSEPSESAATITGWGTLSVSEAFDNISRNSFFLLQGKWNDSKAAPVSDSPGY